MNSWTRLIAVAVLGTALNGPAAWADTSTQATEAATVVTAFNAALTARDLEKAATYFAPGSVQFSLRAAHPGMGGEQAASLSGDLRSHWMMIGSVLISATKAYSRKADIINSRADGDIATVWAKISTLTDRADQPKPRTDEFVEAYLMVKKDGRWLIGAIVDNRKPNDVGMGGPQ